MNPGPVPPGVFAQDHLQTYTVFTPIYEGPLDLLLQLIEHAELDITSLSLALVTDQYLERLRILLQSDAEAAVYTGDVSAFLVIASRLIQIKSEALLPRPPAREAGEEDLGEALARQLLTYKRFKELAEMLQRRELAGLRTFPRLAPIPAIEGSIDLSGLSVGDLLAAAQIAFSQIDPRPSLASVVSLPRVTIREKILLIADFLRQNQQVSFAQIVRQSLAQPGDNSLPLDAYSRLDIVVTFLALLELVKRSMIIAHQEGLFGKIELEPTDSLVDNVSFELEFGE